MEVWGQNVFVIPHEIGSFIATGINSKEEVSITATSGSERTETCGVN
jgi:hypothetical protein